jgi:hypothetical protein
VNGVSYKAGTQLQVISVYIIHGINDEGKASVGAWPLTEPRRQNGTPTIPIKKDFIPANFSLGGTYITTFSEVHK